jgi:hypothetical protein
LPDHERVKDVGEAFPVSRLYDLMALNTVVNIDDESEKFNRYSHWIEERLIRKDKEK